MIESLIPFYEPTEKIIERALDCNQFDSDMNQIVQNKAEPRECLILLMECYADCVWSTGY